MPLADLLEGLALGAAVLVPLVIGLAAVAVADRRQRREQQQPTPLEVYAAMRLRKHDTVRHMRQVAREHERSNDPRRHEGR